MFYEFYDSKYIPGTVSVLPATTIFGFAQTKLLLTRNKLADGMARRAEDRRVAYESHEDPHVRSGALDIKSRLLC